MLEEDYSFNCPYCMATTEMRVDTTAGSKQKFTQDCQVCCKPIAIQIQVVDGEVVSFDAEREE